MFKKENQFLFGLDTSIPGSYSYDTEDLLYHAGGNTGNFAFHYGIVKEIELAKRVAWVDPVDVINSAGNVGIVPVANQVGPHVDMQQFAKIFEQLTSRFVAIGLGAQSDMLGRIGSVPPGTVAWLRAMIDRAPTNAPNVTVRGEFTARVMEGLGFGDNIEILGCPSHFINPNPELGKELAKRSKLPIRRIAVCAGHSGWTGLAKLEQSLARLVTVTNGAYIAQSDLPMVQLLRGRNEMSHDELRRLRDYILPELEMGEMLLWARRFGNVFCDVDHWMEQYRRYDFVIGVRIHGVMLALQAGVPAVCIVHDGRTLELCQTMKIPYILASDYVDGLTRAEIPALLDVDWAEYDRNRATLARRYGDFLQRNNLVMTSHMKTLLEAMSARQEVA